MLSESITKSHVGDLTLIKDEAFQ